jgi:inhibitor of cysteine peptidase
MSESNSASPLSKGSRLVAKSFSAVMIGITLGLIVINFASFLMLTPNIVSLSSSSAFARFSSYSQLKAFLNNSRNVGPYPYYYVNSFGGGQPVILSTVSPAAFGVKESGVDYSKTNIQVEGVDEPDIVKSDGEYLYVASSNKVLILKAYPANDAQVVADLQLNGTVAGLFVSGDRLVVFESVYQDIVFGSMPSTVFPSESMVQIKVYDIADRSNPVLVRTTSSDGWYFTARMIGDYVYVIINAPAYLSEGEVTLPIIIKQGGVEEINATDVYYMNITDYNYGFTTVFAVNIKDESVEPTHETFLLGASSVIYASLNNVYLAIPSYDPETSVEMTHIVRILVQGNTISSEASGEVPGQVLNQYSMDEYEGYFRIATTTGSVSRTLGQSTASNNVYVLNMNLTVVGRLEDIAPGEKIYSARFMGSRCYLVTFKKVDPLFVIGLDDPAAPRVLGKLKIPGFSDYLHPYSENLLIGIGKETVDAEEGDFAWYQGIKIALFNVSDVENPRQVAEYIIGDRGTDSPVLSDPKDFLFDRDRNLLAIPILLAQINESQYPGGVPPNAYGEYVWQGLYVFTITENSITLRGRVTHIDNEDDFLKSGYYFYSEYSVKRGLYIEDMLYSISDMKVKVNDLTSLESVNEIKLP